MPRISKQKLDARYRDFARHYVANGGNASDAAREAGWSDVRAATMSSKMLNNANVQAMILEETMKAFAINVPVGFNGIMELARNAENETVRLNACKELLDRGGLQLAQEMNLTIDRGDERTDEEIVAETLALLKQDADLEKKFTALLAHNGSAVH